MTAVGRDEFWTRAERDLAGKIDTAVPQSARVWNCWPGGKDYYEADERAAAECS